MAVLALAIALIAIVTWVLGSERSAMLVLGIGIALILLVLLETGTLAVAVSTK